MLITFYFNILTCDAHKAACLLYFIAPTSCHATLQCIENLNGLSIVFYHSYSTHRATLQHIENLNGLSKVSFH